MRHPSESWVLLRRERRKIACDPSFRWDDVKWIRTAARWRAVVWHEAGERDVSQRLASHRILYYAQTMQGWRTANFILAGVRALLIIQLVLFYVSMNTIFEISAFCTATEIPALKPFGLVHAAFAGFFVLGLASLLWKRAQVYYIVGISILLLALPMQAWLVAEAVLYCDGP